MKLFNSLPETVRQKGKSYKILSAVTPSHIQDLNLLKAKLREEGTAYITVHVLAKNLRGKTDLHGQQYQPSTWIYVDKKTDLI